MALLVFMTPLALLAAGVGSEATQEVGVRDSQWVGSRGTAAPIANGSQSGFAVPAYDLALDLEGVSMRADDVPLVRVLEDLSRRTGMGLSIEGSLQRRVSDTFRGLSLRDCLHRLLRGENFVLRTVGSAGPESRGTNHLWIYASSSAPPVALQLRGEAPRLDTAWLQQLDPVALQRELARRLVEDREAAVASIEQLVLFSDLVSVRQEAVRVLASLNDPERVPTLERALVDASEDLRSQVIESLSEIDGSAAARAIEHLLGAPDAWTRERAIYALGRRAGAGRLLHEALSDPVESVRRAAAEVLVDRRSAGLDETGLASRATIGSP